MFAPILLGQKRILARATYLDVDFERSEPEESANGMGKTVEAQPSQDQGVAVGRSIRPQR